MEEAGQAGADRWAPRDFERACARFEEGLLEYRRQEVRLYSFRDFAAAESLLAAAHEAAREATARADRLHGNAEEEARAELETAESAVGSASELAVHLHLPPDDLRLLGGCRSALTGAKEAHGRGDLLSTTRLARTARSAADSLALRCLHRTSRYTEASLLEKWRALERKTIDRSGRSGGVALVIVKAAHRLTVYRAGRAVVSFDVDVGYNNTADKLQCGDGATPEGEYRVVEKKGRGSSKYHKALLIDYPNREDLEKFRRALRSGTVRQGSSPGGLIEIHGEGGRGTDWTKGCVALANDDMDRLFDEVKVGTPVTIIGSDGRESVFTSLARKHRPAQRSQAR